MVCLLLLCDVMSGVVQLTFYQQKAEENREGWVDLHLALSPLPDSHKEESKQIIRRVTRHPRPVFHRPIVGWLVQLLGCFTLHVGSRDCHARAPPRGSREHCCWTQKKCIHLNCSHKHVNRYDIEGFIDRSFPRLCLR